MLTKRPTDERGHTDIGWLDSYHTFSFGGYYDPKHMHWGPLRVINDDIVQGGQGFGEHPHQDAEIFSYILEGSLAHKDSMGNRKDVHAHEVQYMSAGSGVEHAEFNGSDSKQVHFLQIWVMPSQKGLTPRYEQKKFPPEVKTDKLCLMLSESGENDSIKISQNIKVYSSILTKDKGLSYPIKSDRLGWIQVISGAIQVNNEVLEQGDGLAIKEESFLNIYGKEKSEFLLFDMLSM